MRTVAFLVVCCAAIFPCLARAQTPEQNVATALGSQIGGLYLQVQQQKQQIADLDRQLADKEKSCSPANQANPTPPAK